MNVPAKLARIANGRTDLIADVVADKAVSEWPQAEGASLLQWAAYYGDAFALRYLLGLGAPLASMGPDLGLNGAAFHGHWQLCELLIECGAKASYTDPVTGETPLHSALTNEDRTRYDRVVIVLLRAGADANAATVPGVATGAFMRDCRTRGEGPLHRAAAFGTADTVRLLLDAGAKPEQLDHVGDTPLSWASWYRRPTDILRLLLHGEHRIRVANRSMRENLLGTPHDRSRL